MTQRLNKKLHEIVDNGYITILVTVMLGFAGWIGISTIQNQVAIAETRTQLTDVASSVDEIKSDIKSLVLPRLGVNPGVLSYVQSLNASSTAQK